MSQTFILQNQDKLFFGKNKEWVDGYDANAVFKTIHKDEAINQMFETTSKDYQQRVKVLECALNDKGLPVIDAEIMPAPLPKVPKPPKAGAVTEESEAAEALDAAAIEADTSETDTDEIPDGDLAELDDTDPRQETLPLV